MNALSHIPSLQRGISLQTCQILSTIQAIHPDLFVNYFMKNNKQVLIRPSGVGKVFHKEHISLFKWPMLVKHNFEATLRRGKLSKRLHYF